MVDLGSDRLPVAVIGAGPVGLAAAAHLAERSVPFVVLEAGDAAATAVQAWSHIQLFSPWEFNTDPAARRLLAAAGWEEPDASALPTGGDLVKQYLQPLAELPALASHIRYGAEVTAISRLGIDRLRTADRDAAPFVLRLADGEEVLARAVIDASGTWRQPNHVGANGLPAHGEKDAAAWINHGLPDVFGADRDQHAGRHTVVVGAGHSAANTLLALAELADTAPGTTITWAIRGADPAASFGGGSDDELPARGAIGSGLKMLVETGRVTLAANFRTHAVRRLGDDPRATRWSSSPGPWTAPSEALPPTGSSRPPASGPTTASSTSCAWSSTRSCPRPVRSPRSSTPTSTPAAPSPRTATASWPTPNPATTPWA